MSWNAFLGAVTWCLTVLALLSSFSFLATAIVAWEDGKQQKAWVILCAGLSVVLLVAGVAIIAGMGWYPK